MHFPTLNKLNLIFFPGQKIIEKNMMEKVMFMRIWGENKIHFFSGVNCDSLHSTDKDTRGRL